MHDPRVGRFLSLDPLSPQYPHNSPFVFSENRVIDGIELEGAEYLDADVATVMANYDVILVNRSNIGIPARDKISVNIYDSYGKLVYSRIKKLSKYNLFLDSYKQADYNPPPLKSDNSSQFENANIDFIEEGEKEIADLRSLTKLGEPNKTQTTRLIGTGFNSSKIGTARGGLALGLAVESVHLWYWWSSNKDIKLIKKHHAIMVEKVLPAIHKALEKGGYIPKHLKDEFHIGLIANVILYGGDKDYKKFYTEEVIDVGMRIYNEIAIKDIVFPEKESNKKTIESIINDEKKSTKKEKDVIR